MKNLASTKQLLTAKAERFNTINFNIQEMRRIALNAMTFSAIHMVSTHGNRQAIPVIAVLFVVAYAVLAYHENHFRRIIKQLESSNLTPLDLERYTQSLEAYDLTVPNDEHNEALMRDIMVMMSVTVPLVTMIAETHGEVPAVATGALCLSGFGLYLHLKHDKSLLQGGLKGGLIT